MHLCRSLLICDHVGGLLLLNGPKVTDVRQRLVHVLSLGLCQLDRIGHLGRLGFAYFAVGGESDIADYTCCYSEYDVL